MSVWLLLALASALFLGGYEVSRKAALGATDALWTLLLASVGGWIFLSAVLVLAWFSGPERTFDLRLVPLSLGQHGLILIKAAIVSLSWVCAYAAVAHLPISIASPLRASSPALTILGALLIFGEQPSLWQWLGILVIFFGYLAFARIGKQEGHSFAESRWVWLLVVGTFIGALSGLYDKHLLQGHSLHPTTLQFWFCAYAILLQALVVWVLGRRARSRRPASTVGGASSPWPWSAPLAGILLIFADQFYFRALARDGAMVSVIALVRRSSVIVSFSLGSYLFGDRLLGQKTLALAVVLLGLLVLVFS